MNPGVPAGISLSCVSGDNKDRFAMIYAPGGMSVAGMFTRNSCPAHPVLFSKKNISNDLHRLIFINKGSANAATGSRGAAAMDDLLIQLEQKLGVSRHDILLASTGVIGSLPVFPHEKIGEISAKKEDKDVEGFARAIMTTDTHPKIVYRECSFAGSSAGILGIAKGSGMIAPNMATMLAFILTDVPVKKSALQKALNRAGDKTFNCLVVDGDTSTNDTVFLASAGIAKSEILDEGVPGYERFCESLEDVCLNLTKELARDGEGATKLISVRVEGALSNESAKIIARAVAVSPLVKTAFYGASPNWGRIVSAIGATGIVCDMGSLCFSLNGILWIDKGVPVAVSGEKIAAELKKEHIELELNLNTGNGRCTVYTCDMSPEYVSINADYLS